MARLARIALAVGTSALTLTATLAGAAPASADDGNNRADVVFGAGSDTTYFLMQKLDDLYNGSVGCATTRQGVTAPLNGQCAAPGVPDVRSENYTHDVIAEYFPNGSGNGKRQLAQQGLAGVNPIGFARSSSGPAVSDAAGLRYVAFARDAIDWVSFPNAAGSSSAGVQNLSLAQLRSIFTQCTTKDWRQLKDTAYVLPAGYDGTAAGDQPIAVYAAQAGSGTRTTFDGFLGGSSDACIPLALKDGNQANGERVIFENNARPIAQSPDAKNAISYYSFGRYTQSGGEGSVLGKIGGVSPTPDSLQADAEVPFSFSRNLYNIYRNQAVTTTAPNASAAARAYVGELDGFLCRVNEGHAADPANGVNYGLLVERTIQIEGFVPIRPGAIGGGVTGTSKCRVVASN